MTSSSIYDISVKTINKQEQKMIDYKGKVLLIVNTASQCGFTKQYEGLEKLYKKYSEKGFVVLAFPCNQFGQQEPGDSEEIKNFCKLNYDTSFPLFEKVDVNGPDAHPLFKYLKSKAKGIFGTQNIKWNFTKFLVGKEGEVLKRYASTDTPESLEKDIEKNL